MKNLITYSLWGDAPMYWVGALKNIELCKKYFPGWICRFYIDDTCDKNLIKTLESDNVEIVLVNSKDSFHGMFWRFYAASDPEVDIMLSRDCDSRLSDREYYAIQDWLKTDKDFHIMRDHPYHTVPILGGMWGCRNGILKNIKTDIENWTFFSEKGCDQDFLGKVIYPKIINNAVEHIGFNINFGGNIKSFPTERKKFEYVGDIFDENDNRHPEYWKILQLYIND